MPDTLIKNGWLIDGSGAPQWRADIAIQNGKLIDIGLFEGATADRVIDARGMIVAPGFIDMHSHADFTLPICPTADSLVQQGITTAVVGNCGHSMAPLFPATRHKVIEEIAITDGPIPWNEWDTFESYFDTLSKIGTSINLVPLLGHGVTRAGLMGFSSGRASPEQMAAMQLEVRKALAAGAYGISTGLIYPPGSYSSTEELVEFTSPVAERQGLYFTHMRDEAENLLEAVAEAIRIGQESGARVQISHFKAAFSRNWDKAQQALELIDLARAQGLDVSADMYPYLAGATYLKTTIPEWAHEGGAEALLARLRSREQRERIIETSKTMGFFRSMNWEKVIFGTAPDKPEWEGRYIPALAEEAGKSAWEWVFDALIATRLQASIVYFMMSEENLRMQLRHPVLMIGTDGEARALTGPMAKGLNHPRSYGTFPRVLGEYVRKQAVLTYKEAIHKMTGLPAQKLGWQDRGLIRKGFAADIVIFDPQTICDLPSYENPYQTNVGIETVLVNGIPVFANGKPTGAVPGQRIPPPGK